MADANQTMRRASGIVASGGLGALVVEYGVGGTFYAVFEVFIAMIYNLGDNFLAPFMALYGGVADFVNATIVSGIRIIQAGGRNSAESITTGYWAQLGPLTYALGIVSFLLGLYVVIWFMRRSEWRPWNIITGLR